MPPAPLTFVPRHRKKCALSDIDVTTIRYCALIALYRLFSSSNNIFAPPSFSPRNEESNDLNGFFTVQIIAMGPKNYI
jgi:hypothetical protein